ncbi:MAG: hypothetical protein Q8921_02745 [Bacteroidota bacterium]|nr:hypothetical protein [Bacteroidota bacterium]MDP4241636.1 hypothetical protein [Bacteroidota bacterium]
MKRPNFYQDSAVIVHGDGHLDTVSTASLAAQDSLDRLDGIVPMEAATRPKRPTVAPSPFVDPREPRPNDPPTRRES